MDGIKIRLISKDEKDLSRNMKQMHHNDEIGANKQMKKVETKQDALKID